MSSRLTQISTSSMTITVSKIRKNIYRSDLQVAFELYQSDTKPNLVAKILATKIGNLSA